MYTDWVNEGRVFRDRENDISEESDNGSQGDYEQHIGCHPRQRQVSWPSPSQLQLQRGRSKEGHLTQDDSYHSPCNPE